jgi:flavin reductase (DIM6/NTAB) family NADH-FMN oxidoreductase RutF
MTVMSITAFDPRAFRQALGQFPTGVCVVTCMVSGERIGMTISSFNSLSLHPPLVLFSIDHRTASLPLWKEAQGYAVNVLAENQGDTPIDSRDHFPASGREQAFRPEAPVRQCCPAWLRYLGAFPGPHTGVAITHCSSLK